MKIDDLCVVCQPHPQVEWTESGLEKKIILFLFFTKTKIEIMKRCNCFHILLEGDLLSMLQVHKKVELSQI